MSCFIETLAFVTFASAISNEKRGSLFLLRSKTISRIFISPRVVCRRLRNTPSALLSPNPILPANGRIEASRVSSLFTYNRVSRSKSRTKKSCTSTCPLTVMSIRPTLTSVPRYSLAHSAAKFTILFCTECNERSIDKNTGKRIDNNRAVDMNITNIFITLRTRGVNIFVFMG